MALRLDGLSVTNPKGLKAGASSLSLLEELALTLILFTDLLVLLDDDGLLLLQQLLLVVVEEEMARLLRVGENIADNTIVAKQRASIVQVEWKQNISTKLATVFVFVFLFISSFHCFAS